MRIISLEFGVFEGDEIIMQLAEGEDLSTVDLSGYRLTADELAKAFDKANAQKTVEAAKFYAALKQATIRSYRKGLIQNMLSTYRYVRNSFMNHRGTNSYDIDRILRLEKLMEHIISENDMLAPIATLVLELINKVKELKDNIPDSEKSRIFEECDAIEQEIIQVMSRS
jgi:hypothetical protein